MVFNDAGEILLIRNSYGNSALFVLPGGGIRRRENPEDAALREVREEVGLQVAELTLVGIYESGAEGKRDRVHLFKARAQGAPSVDSIEVEEARFFAPNDLPDNVSPATLRRLHELEGTRPIDGGW